MILLNTIKKLKDDLNKIELDYLSVDTETYYRDDLKNKPFIKIGDHKNNAPFLVTISYTNKNTGEISDYVFSEEIINSKAFKKDLFSYLRDRNIKLFATNCKFDMTMLSNIGVDILANTWGEYLNLPYHTHPEDFESTNKGKVAGSLKKQGKKYIKGYKDYENVISSLRGDIAKEKGIKKDAVSYKDVYDRFPEKMIAYAKYDTHVQEQLINFHYNEILKFAKTPAFNNMYLGKSEWDIRKRSYHINDSIIKDIWQIEQQGMFVDRKKINNKRLEFEKAIKIFEDAIIKSLDPYLDERYRTKKGEILNVNSGIQMAMALSKKYGLKWVHYTDKGNIQFNKDVVKALKVEISIKDDLSEKDKELASDLELITTSNKINKYSSTYLVGLTDYINSKSYVNPTFRIIGTITGRFSSSNPNFQNIPKGKTIFEFKLENKKYVLDVRDIFGLENKENYIVKMDYDQQEYRFAGQLSKAKSLTKFIREGKDIHTATASLMFNVPYDQVDKNLRSKGKTQNFGVIYGLGTLNLCKALGYKLDFDLLDKGYQFMKKYHKNHTNFPEVYNIPPHKSIEEWENLLNSNKDTLAKKIVLSLVKDPLNIKEKKETYKAVSYYLSNNAQKILTETRDLKKVYQSQFPEIKDYDNQLKAQVKENGFVYTEHGNPRKLNKNETYKALNTMIQGSCAEMQKNKIRELFVYIESNQLKTKIRNLVHDEIIFEVPKDELNHVAKMQSILETFPQYDFNFTVGLEIGKTWSNCIEIEKKDLPNIKQLVEKAYPISKKQKRAVSI